MEVNGAVMMAMLLDDATVTALTQKNLSMKYQLRITLPVNAVWNKKKKKKAKQRKEDKKRDRESENQE